MTCDGVCLAIKALFCSMQRIGQEKEHRWAENGVHRHLQVNGLHNLPGKREGQVGEGMEVVGELFGAERVGKFRKAQQ